MDLGLDDDEEAEEVSVDLPMPNGMALRPYQVEAIEKIAKGWETYSRQLAVLATGAGKTIIFSHITKAEVAKGGRVLVVAHTEELLDQAADKLFKSTGLVSEREKAQDFASLSANVVIASIQTLAKDARLTAFPDDHFSLIICDECHRLLAVSYQKVFNYFHFGRQSLDPEWVMPEPGAPFKYHARVLGVTATADRGDKRNLGQYLQGCLVEYGILEAVRDGYLVRPIAKTLPLKIDLKGVKMRGHDLDAAQVSERLTPLLKEIARQIKIEAGDRKTMIWLPSVDAAQRLSEALKAEGLNASFVSGACPDRVEKIEAFRKAGIGSVICNAMLLTEGVDIADVSCGCMLRATRIRSLLVQAMGRGTRVLPGVIDGLETAAERVAAIAASAKPNMLILDFLWLSDRLDLISAVDLVATRPALRDAMAKAAGEGTVDLLELEGVATRDLLKSLEAAAKKNANKAARVMDPLAWAVDLGDEKLATYEPETAFDARPPTPGQLTLLQKQHFDISKIRYFGQASAVITRLMARYRMRLASPQQLHFLHQLGLAPDKATLLSAADASKTIDAILAEKKARRASSGS